jgi:hypothetical protein
MVAMLAAVARPAAAEDALWLAGIAQGPVKGKLVTWLEVQPRFAGTTDSYILRPALGVQLDPRVQLLAGYHYQLNDPVIGPDIEEHRLWQQALVRLAGRPGKAVLLSRTRLEQRFVVGEADDAMRLRQFLRGQVWLDEGWSVILVGEAFVGLESTDWGQRRGLEQFRSFVALGRQLSPRLTLEAGYLNQRIVRPGRDRANDVLNLTLFYRLG